jgi:hypothetical protein
LFLTIPYLKYFNLSITITKSLIGKQLFPPNGYYFLLTLCVYASNSINFVVCEKLVKARGTHSVLLFSVKNSPLFRWPSMRCQFIDCGPPPNVVVIFIRFWPKLFPYLSFGQNSLPQFSPKVPLLIRQNLIVSAMFFSR